MEITAPWKVVPTVVQRMASADLTAKDPGNVVAKVGGTAWTAVCSWNRIAMMVVIMIKVQYALFQKNWGSYRNV